MVRLVIAGRSAAALGALVVFRPRRRPMHWQFERPESGLPFEGDISAVTL